MATELSSRIGPRVYPKQSWHRPSNGCLDDSTQTHGSEPGAYATKQDFPQDSVPESDASSRASTPKLLTRLGDTISPKSLLERVKPRFPIEPISFTGNPLAYTAVESRVQDTGSPNIGTDQLVPPILPEQHSNSPMDTGTPQTPSTPMPPRAAECSEPTPVPAIESPVDDFDIPGLSATSAKAFLDDSTSTESGTAIPGLASSRITSGTTAKMGSPTPLPVAEAVVCLEDSRKTPASPIQEVFSASGITRDQLISRVRDLVTPLVVENSLLREKVHEGPLSQKRKELADNAVIALGDDRVCLSFVRHAIDVHAALINSGKIKGQGVSTKAKPTIPSDGRTEPVTSGRSVMPPSNDAPAMHSQVQHLPPLYFSLHDAKKGTQGQQSPSRLHLPPSAPRSMRTTSFSKASPPGAVDALLRSRPADKQGFSPRRRSPSIESRVSGRRGSPSRCEPPLNRDGVTARQHPTLRRSVSPGRSRATANGDRRELAKPFSFSSRRRSPGPNGRKPSLSLHRGSPPPGSAPARFQGWQEHKRRESQYESPRQDYGSRSPDRDRRWGNNPHSPAGDRRDNFTDRDRADGRRRPQSSPQWKWQGGKAKERSWSRERRTGNHEQGNRPRTRSRSRSRGRHEGPSDGQRDTPRRPFSPSRTRSPNRRSNPPFSYASFSRSPRARRGRESPNICGRERNSYASPFEYGIGSSRPPTPPRRIEASTNVTLVPLPTHMEGGHTNPHLAPAPVTRFDTQSRKTAKPVNEPLVIRRNRDDEMEPGQVSSLPSKETGSRSYLSSTGDVPGLALMQPEVVGTGDIEDSHGEKSGVAELGQQRLQGSPIPALRLSPGNPHLAVAGNSDMSLSPQPQPSQVADERESGEMQSSAPSKKRSRSASTEAERDRTLANRKRGKALEVEREQAKEHPSLDATKIKNTSGEDEKEMRKAVSPPVPSSKIGAKVEGSKMVESPQSFKSSALPLKVLPCHFVPGVWYIHHGSEKMETKEYHLVIDQATADKWALPGSASPEKPRLSLELRCYAYASFGEKMQTLKSDATLHEVARVLADVPQSWPPRKDLPLVTLNPGASSEKTWLPRDMPFLSDKSKAIQLESHLVVGENLLRIMQLSPVAEFTFALYAYERSH